MNLSQFQTWAVTQGSVGNPGSGSFRGQCVSLIQNYLNLVYGIGYQARGNAKDWPTNSNVLSYFDKVSSPQAGDIGVMGANYGSGAGHIFIYLSPTTILEQNGRVPLKVSTGAAYKNPIAILRRKGQGEDMNNTIDNCRRIAYFTWGINGIYTKANALNGDLDDAFRKDPAWLGADPITCQQTRADAQEAHDYTAWIKKQSEGGGQFTQVNETLYRKAS